MDSRDTAGWTSSTGALTKGKGRVAEVEAGKEREGVFKLFSLRN